MLNALSELKKYQKIDINNINNINNTNNNNKNTNTNIDMFAMLAEDIKRISKNQFKMEHQLEDCFEEIEGITQILNQELDMAKTYREALRNKDDFIKEIKLKSEEKEEHIQSLILALISFLDNIDLIHTAILASGDEEWLRQMNRVKNSLALVLQGNALVEIGHEKYFNDQLHDVVSLVEDENRDFREITGVEQKGYSYQGNIHRKAHVIVNNYKNIHNKNFHNKNSHNDRNNNIEGYQENGNGGDENEL